MLGVISDTHASLINVLPPNLLKQLEDCNLIFHLGDIDTKNILEDLAKIAPVLAVSGNCDSDVVTSHLPKIAMLHLFKWRIMGTHMVLSANPKHAIIQGGMSMTFLKEFTTIFFPRFDVLLFGHTHKRLNERFKGKLFVNPGAVYKSYGGPESFAKLYITPEEIEVKFIHARSGKEISIDGEEL